MLIFFSKNYNYTLLYIYYFYFIFLREKTNIINISVDYQLVRV